MKPHYNELRVQAKWDCTTLLMSSSEPCNNEALYRDLFDNAPVGYHEVDAVGHIVRVNRTEASMLGYEPEEMNGRYAWEFVVESVSKEAFKAKLAGTLPLSPFERTFIKKNGEHVSVMIEERLLRDEHGLASGIRTSVFDITARKRAELALRESEERYRQLVEHSPDAILVQVGGLIVFANDAAVKLLGASRPASLQNLRLIDFVHLSCRDVAFEQLYGPVDQFTRAARVELRLVNFDGVPVDVELIAMGTSYENQAAVQMVLRDITSRKLEEEQIRTLAYHDGLTQLPNRILFRDRLHMAIAQATRQKQKIGLLFIDLDRFKEINDSLGHAMGDLVLRAVAQRLKCCVREGDTVGRFGGDEFVVLIPGLQSSIDVAVAAEKLLQALHLPIHVQGKELFATASVGASILPDDTDDIDGLLRNADVAMYRAKQQGRDNYQLFSAEMQVRASERYSLENSLPKALVDQEFVVYYQPMFALGTGRISGFEALVRWRHPELGLLAAAQFLSVAEKSGHIAALGAWVLENACAQLRRWQVALGNALVVSVNLSGRQLQHARFIEDAKQALATSGVAATSLQFEISEAAIATGDGVMHQTIQELSGLGARVVVDNFGVCGCTISCLRRLPIHGLKLDSSLVRGVDRDPADAGIARAVVAASRSLGLYTVAAQVETLSQLSVLREIGFDAAQGNQLGEPMDGEACVALLEQQVGAERH